MPDKEHTHDSSVVTKERSQTRKPKLYKVLLHNDDYTPMDFVVHILETVFRKTQPEAVHIMLSVHQRGVGIAGVYTYEIAESKSNKVMDMARRDEHPLQCSIEPE